MPQRRDALLAALAQLHQERMAASSTQTGAPDHEALTTSTRRRGFVSIVGAGPGDPELLTRRAARRLAEADLVLYDALVSAATVSLARNAQQVFVGRRRGSATVGQDAIIRTLIRAARRGRRVVRLKGGDPFVFGRGGEEALALAAAGVPFEIVPGVSSALAAAASAAIPVTHRGVSGSVLVTSGHDLERFSSLVASIPPGGATLVILMGTALRVELSASLLDAGWGRSTPAAVIRSASLPEQTVWTGTLATLPLTADDGAPGTIVVGDVVALRRRLVGDTGSTAREVCHG
jgi:uroporphyrin-III C-methyltransferase/precorrin-2 dehydrogenase/sirohydrochlorin ferrochelatase